MPDDDSLAGRERVRRMKRSDTRREELLATAERLFGTRGYEQTSVQDIIDEMHYSKGGFYHHFDSKLALLEAICEARAQETCEAARHAAQAGQTAVEKLNALFHSSALWQSENPGFMTLLIQVAYRQDGALMREKMKACQLACMQPMMEDVLKAGIHSGEFFIGDVQTSAGLIVRLYMQFTDEIAFLLAGGESEEKMNDAMVRKLRVYRTAIERMLIAPFGSVVLFEAKELALLGQRILRSRVRQRADSMLAK